MTDQTRNHRLRTELSVTRLEDRTNPSDFIPGRVIVSVKPGVDIGQAIAAFQSIPSTAGIRHLGGNAYRVDLKPGMTVEGAIGTYEANSSVKNASPDYRAYKDWVPNDTYVTDGSMWAVRNTGQNGGTAGADISAINAWDTSIGTRETIVAVVDDGISTTHPDLVENLWTNTGEIAGNGIDDDGNGYVDDVHGYDFVDVDSNVDPDDPAAGDGHGTHVAGTIGAVGNNTIGTTGVNPRTRLMAIKMFGTSGNSGISAAIEGFYYAVDNGAKILNNSWRYYGDIIPEFADAMTYVQSKGGIMVASAGNDSLDNDVTERYPSNFTRLFDNALAIAATDRNDQLASFSNWGANLVTMGAPGVAIYSTVPIGYPSSIGVSGYDSFDGTSMATPQVSGALALGWDVAPSATYQDLIQALTESADQIGALQGITKYGGRLNLNEFLARLRSPSYATGAGAGGGPLVKQFRGTSVRPAASFFAYDQAFSGGVRVASADFNGDGTTDVVTVPGAGGGPHVRVFDGKTNEVLAEWMAFEQHFKGGLFVAAGDVDGDGTIEVIVSADKGGGPRVGAFQVDIANGTGVRIADFFAYDISFSGGVRVTVGDVNDDGRMEVITAPGMGGGPHVKVFDAYTGGGTQLMDTMAGNPLDRNGLFVAAADMNADGMADIIIGAGADTPAAMILNGTTLNAMLQMTPTAGPMPGLVTDPITNQLLNVPRRSFPQNLIPATVVPDNGPVVLTGNQTPRSLNGYVYGTRVAVHDVNGDGVHDLIFTGGPADSPIVSIVNGKTFTEIRSFNAYEDYFYGGVFVGGIA
jgi:subtilisin family serine protease